MLPAATAKPGVLLINLGTPVAPETGAVRDYLAEFLSDPRVLDLPGLARAILVHLVIVPFRAPKSAAAYRKIWKPEGSPLLTHSQQLASQVSARLGPSVPVEVAMRYGRPSIASALWRLKQQGVDRVVVLPLYPQYAASSTGSAIEEVYRVVGSWWNVPAVQVVGPFYDHPGFVRAFSEVARGTLEEARPDYLLFSFHGLPERQIKKSDDTQAHCLLSAGCCEAITDANRHCYRAQCYATARALVGALDWDPDRYGVAFQSRLGRTPWIQPFTDHVLPHLAAEGYRRVAVMCPAFTADCLETLEEIGMRAADDFRAQGGEALELVPSLNAHPAWVDAVVEMLAPFLPEPTQSVRDPAQSPLA